MSINVGDVYYADLSPCIGEEIGGIRPVIIEEVISGDLVTVCFTSSYSKYTQVRTIDVSRLKEAIVKTDSPEFEQKEVIEVIRCKNCKHFTHYTCKPAGTESIRCKLNGLTSGENDYCSYGEQR